VLGLALCLFAAMPLSAQADSFVAAGSMNTPRSDHTATLLVSGKVLVAGGYEVSGCCPSASAELFDPVSGSWSATGAMVDSRIQLTATLLPNGMVLVAGGQHFEEGVGTVYLARAELYDPATGTWRSTGSMTAPRNVHTATLLPNGTVLVVGGQDGRGPGLIHATAEIYDPATEQWTVTGPMAVGRMFHTATLLSNGKVLVSGGSTPITSECPIGCVASSAELFDPSTGVWTATGAMSGPHMLNTATLLPSGEVLVVGGDGFNIASRAETYDPVTEQWSPTGSMAGGVTGGHTATLLQTGKVLVAGGLISTAVCTPGAELYDPATDTWAAAGEMTETRCGHTATLLASGKVLLAAGNSPGGFLSSSELYNADGGAGDNEAPVAANDTYSANQGNGLAVPVADGVLANDNDPDGDTLSAIIVSGPTHGALALADDGSFLYTPTADFAGSDAFSYRATDGSLTSNLVTVTINATGLPAIIESQPRLASGQKASLKDKLAAAATLFSSGKLNPACGKLSEFVSQVSGLTPSKLSPSAATVLITGASALKALYGCPT
jgi:hypothetical protein